MGRVIPGSGLSVAARRGWSDDRTHFCSLAAAAIAHLVLLVLLLPDASDVLGDHGLEIEAIAVSVVASVPNAAGAAEPVAPAAPAPAAPEPPPEASEAARDQVAKPRQQEQVAALTLSPEAEPAEPSPVTLPMAPPKLEVVPKEKPDEEAKEMVIEAAAQFAETTPPPPPPSAAAAPVSAGAMQAYARQLAMTLAKSKPKGTGVTGTVRVRFVVAPDGRPLTTVVVVSSGKPRLDELALATIGQNTFPPPPAGATEPQRTFVVPYDFR